MISYRPGAKRLEATPFSLPKEIHKFDVPVGTEVYHAASDNEQTNSEQDADGQLPARAESKSK
tara:strand:- start:9272 stop:9460 length:189 start_codon:yes stop_codon:yes gene_type:complete